MTNARRALAVILPDVELAVLEPQLAEIERLKTERGRSSSRTTT
jgi:hypothetical protein